MPFEIEGHGWELQVKRLGLQHRAGERVRTYGAYQLFIDGAPVTGLSGHICECAGPGDNTANVKKEHLRVREGRDALSTQFGKRYRSTGFTAGAKHPMPGFLLLGTKVRTAVLFARAAARCRAIAVGRGRARGSRSGHACRGSCDLPWPRTGTE
jgi:hypothetical protein